MKKYLSLLSLALVMSLSLVACSSDDKKDSGSKSDSENTKTTKKSEAKSDKKSDNPIVGAALASEGESSVEIDGTLTFSGDALNGTFLINGKQSFENKESVFTVDMGALLASLGGGGVEAPTSYIIEVRTKGGYVYTKTPSLFGGEEKWIKTTATDSAANASQDPAQYLQFMKGASSDFSKVGTEEIDGVETDKYDVTLDPELFKKQAIDAAGEEGAKEVTDSINKTFTKPVKASIWIDKKNLVRKTEMNIEIDGGTLLGSADPTGSAASAIISMQVVMNFKNYGVDVNVEVPAGAVTQ